MKKWVPLSLILSGILLLASACQATQTPTATPINTPTTSPTGEVVLTLIGSETKTLTMDQIKALPAVEGQAGIISSTGKITPPTLFKGVPLAILAAQVGGADSTMGIEIGAEDGYSMTFSYDQVNQGDFTTYDPATGDEVTNAGKLTPILAYEMDGKPLDQKQDGNLRLVIISEKNNQVVDGHWSVKFINTLTVKPLAADWTLNLEGAIADSVDRGSFESCSSGSCHGSSWTDGKAQEWSGTPLYLIAGRVDDENKHSTGAYNATLAKAGYTIELQAADGYSVMLDSTKIDGRKDILLAYQVNNNNLTEKDFPLRLVGTDLTGKESIGGVVKIILHLPSTAAAEPTSTPTVAVTKAVSSGEVALTLTGLVNAEQKWTLADLQAMQIIQETVTHPKKGEQQVEGVSLNALLDLAGVKPAAKSLVITASDGYNVTVDIAKVRACPKSLVAFAEDGTLKTVMPDMESSAWVKAVTLLEVK